MDILRFRDARGTRSIYDLPLRVTFYARVSSEKDEQLNSLENQVSYYENMIKENANWTFVPGYVDEGISGISVKKREDFNRMIQDAERGLFDLIITKEISRFARNTLDTLQYTRQLLNLGVAVFFQNDGINTLDPAGELRLTIMSSLAQDELRKLSSRVRFGHQQAIKNHVVLGNGRIFGYRKEGKRLVIDEYEAVMVRKLFALYATDCYSMKQIEDILWEDGYRNNNGKKIAHTTMASMIANPKYKGYYVGNKVRVVDMFTKKRVFLPEEEWVIFKDETGELVPAIVDEETWEKANEVLRRRSRDVKLRQNICTHANLLTGKLYCAHCGRLFHRKESQRKGVKNLSTWVCSGKVINGATSCPSFTLYENEIQDMLYSAFETIVDDMDALLAEYERQFAALKESTTPSPQISQLQAELDTIMKKQNKLLEYNASGQLSDAQFLRLNAQCEEDIARLSAQLTKLQNSIISQEVFDDYMASVRITLKKAQEAARGRLINNAFINSFIDRIDFIPVSNNEATIRIKFIRGFEQFNFDASALRHGTSKKPYKTRENSTFDTPENEDFSQICRTGCAVKKMVESYENAQPNG